MNQPTFGSLFAGAGGFDMGFDAAGFGCAWQVEIDRTARDVLAKHWPDVPRHPDVRGVGKKNLARVDVVAGGFPCQDVSTAGKRGGFEKGERSSLWYEMLRVIDELRPAYVVWENVPGLLSADDGRAFGWVLRGLADLGFDGGWRTVDAQFFGVPQQRRRVFGVSARGRAGAERCAEILALAEGVRRRTPSRRKARARLAAAAAGSPRSGGGSTFCELGEGHATYQQSETATSLRSNAGGGSLTANLAVFGGGDCRGERLAAAAITTKGVRQDFDTDNFVLIQDARGGMENKRQNGVGVKVGGPSYTLDTLGAQAVLVPSGAVCAGDGIPKGRTDGLAYALTARAGRGHGMGQAVCLTGDTTHALTAEGHDASEDGTGRGTPVIAFQWNASHQAESESLCPTIRAEAGCGSGIPAVQIGPIVRRLTPRECERLMGWPDDWTRWRGDGREIADGPRYRLCGNGVTKPNSQWLAARMRSLT